MVEPIAKHRESLAARDVANHLHAFTNLRQHEIDGPLVIERGEGIYVWDDRGKRYIEGMSGLWCTTLGFSEERLIAAALAQMRKLPFNPTFRGRSHDVTIELAERLIRIAPAPMSKAFFASSGSEANDTALKIVWYYNSAIGHPKKRKIIARQKSYHGTTIATGLAPFAAPTARTAAGAPMLRATSPYDAVWPARTARNASQTRR